MGYFVTVSYTHEDREHLTEAYKRLAIHLGKDAVLLSLVSNTIVLRYSQVAQEEVALPIVNLYKLKRVD